MSVHDFLHCVQMKHVNWTSSQESCRTPSTADARLGHTLSLVVVYCCHATQSANLMNLINFTLWNF